MSARFSVKRVPRAQAKGIRNGVSLDAYWYRIIDKATGDFVGGRHEDETMAMGECERLNTRT